MGAAYVICVSCAVCTAFYLSFFFWVASTLFRAVFCPFYFFFCFFMSFARSAARRLRSVVCISLNYTRGFGVRSDFLKNCETTAEGAALGGILMIIMALIM